MLIVEEVEVRDLEVNPRSGEVATSAEPHDAATCSHDWQPIDGWTARYRCSTCRAVGYKPCAVHPQHCRDPRIVPYRCEATRSGKRCEHPAVYSQRGKHFRCALHVRPERTAAARKALTAEAGDATADTSAVVQSSPLTKS